MGPAPHTLTIRTDQHSTETANRGVKSRPLKVVVRGWHKSVDLGKFQAANPTETTVSLEVFYIKIELASSTGKNGNVLLELDKYNEIFIVNGVDYLAEVLANT